MIGRIGVTGLSAALILGATGVGAVAASPIETSGLPTLVDVRKHDDEPELVVVEDDEGDDDERNLDQTSASGGDSRPASNSRSNGDPRSGVDSPSRGDSDSSRGAARNAGITPGDLLINQRISQAALRRLAVVEALRANRPVPSFNSNSNGGGIVTVSLAQLRINQRIAQAAVRKANRLEGRAAASQSASGGGNLTLSRAQVRINQRISQAAVRRANALLNAERAQS